MTTFIHATSGANAQLIEAGLCIMPRGNRRGNWDAGYQQQSHPEFVYFSAVNETQQQISGHFHGLRTALKDGSDEVVIYHFDKLDGRRLYPEENFFLVPLTIQYKEDLEAAQSQMKKNKHKWRESMKATGAVCHRGPVDVRDAKVIRYPIKKSPIAFMAEPEWTFKEYEWRWQFYMLTKKPFVWRQISEYKFTKNATGFYTFHTPYGPFHSQRPEDDYFK